jgi:hypothetical protein
MGVQLEGIPNKKRVVGVSRSKTDRCVNSV